MNSKLYLIYCTDLLHILFQVVRHLLTLDVDLFKSVCILKWTKLVRSRRKIFKTQNINNTPCNKAD